MASLKKQYEGQFYSYQFGILFNADDTFKWIKRVIAANNKKLKKRVKK